VGAKRRRRRNEQPPHPFEIALKRARRHLFLAPLVGGFSPRHLETLPEQSWARVSIGDWSTLYWNRKRQGSPEEWLYVIAHALLHLGLGHFRPQAQPRAWAAACDYCAARFIADLKLAPLLSPLPDLGRPQEQVLYQRFCRRGIPENVSHLSIGFPSMDLSHADPQRLEKYLERWEERFALAIKGAVRGAVELAAGRSLEDQRSPSPGEQARSWFVSSYPLLGALAASFEIIEDPLICQRLEISVAAVDEISQEIFLNPSAGLLEEELRFVMAHELLHVGLRHGARCRGRDPWYWNIACDYVINGWLVEMQLGVMPARGSLYDRRLKSLSAESVYDQIVRDLRRYRKLESFAGREKPDILSGRGVEGAAIDLDAFYRRALSQGLSYHYDQERGLLPAGLVEEIRALDQPPIPWDVELARWFDHFFQPLERRRSYARPSRRQASTPKIPRPRWIEDPRVREGRTYGVVLDTSGSMDRRLLAKALGSIASYSVSREVGLVRVVFCDAVAYDQGYMPPEELMERVRVRGRGGTILQPGIRLLENALDFPKKAPILIITDGFCDPLRVKREHAFLLPKGRHLPFQPRGPLFHLE